MENYIGCHLTATLEMHPASVIVRRASLEMNVL